MDKETLNRLIIIYKNNILQLAKESYNLHKKIDNPTKRKIKEFTIAICKTEDVLEGLEYDNKVNEESGVK